MSEQITVNFGGQTIEVEIYDPATAAQVAAAAYQVVLAAASAANSAASATSASGFASIAEAGLTWFNTKAAATAALATIAANAVVGVLIDESQSSRRTLYRKEGGALVLRATLDSLNQIQSIGVVPPTANETWMTITPFDSDNPAFRWNMSETVNAGNAARPNDVLNFGHNLNPGGGVVTAGKGLFGMGFEGHYEPSPGEAYFEWHIYAGFEEDGVQRRPDSMRLDKHSALTNGWVRLMRFNNLTFTEPKKTTPFLQWSPGGLDFRTVQNAGTGEPEGGFSISHYDSGGVPTVNLAQAGSPAIMNFALNGWASVIMGGGMEWQSTNGRFFFDDGLGQGLFGNRNSRFEIVHTADIAIGRYGGAVLAYLDNDNQRLGLGVEVTDPGYAVDIRGSVGFRPGHTTTRTPVANHDLVIETTSNTLLTFKYKGDDGVVRSGTLALA